MRQQLWVSIRLRVCPALAGRYPAPCRRDVDARQRLLYHFNFAMGSFWFFEISIGAIIVSEVYADENGMTGSMVIILGKYRVG